MARPVLIDASFWFGGNRKRGIGAYLDAYFQFHCPIARSLRVWLCPSGTSERETNEIVSRYGGKCWVIQDVQTELLSGIQSRHIAQVLLPSPFERPFSLLDFLSVFQAAMLRVEAIVFDLLPLQYPRKILSTWPEKDQKEYRARASLLRAVDFYWVISPATALVLQAELAIPPQKIKVLRFGLQPDWLQVPQMEKIQRDPHLWLTISGGEWRKNLEGTLQFFAKQRKSGDKLVVICRLGWRRRFQLHLLAIQLGIGLSTHFIGEVSESEKWQYLWRASAFLFLSRAEGLGIPLLEAERANVPRIIVSKELVKSGLASLVKSPEVA